MKSLAILILFVVSYLPLQGQVFQHYKEIIESNTSVDDRIQCVDSLLTDLLSQETDGEIYFKIADTYTSWLYNKDRVDKSLSTLSLLLNKTPKNDTLKLEKRNYKLGFIYRNTGKFIEAIESYKKVTALEHSNSYYLRSLRSIADCYYEIGDYGRSRDYYNLAEKECLKRKDFSNLIKTNTYAYNTFSKINGEAAKKEIELKLLLADSLAQHYPLSLSAYFDISISLGKIYSSYEQRNIEKGELFLKRSLELAHKKADSSLITEVLITYGALLDIEFPKKSIQKLERALVYCPSKQKFLQSIIHANLGLSKAKIGRLDEALESQHKALAILLGNDLTVVDEERIPVLFSENNSNDNLRSILSNLGETYYLSYKKSKALGDLKASIRFFKYADFVIDTYFRSDVSTPSKLLWRQQASLIYSRAIRSCFEANDIETAFNFTEKSKALLLYSERSKHDKLQSSAVPQETLVKLRALNNKIKSLEKTKIQTINSLRLLINAQDSLDLLTRTITKKYPIDSTLNKRIQITTLNEIKDQLKESEVVITYHISADDGFGIAPNTETGYGLLITPTSTDIFSIDSLSIFRQTFDNTLLKLSKKQTNHKESSDLNSHLRKLYKKLFPSHITKAIQGKKITLIPDNYLNTLPFESLITSEKGKPITYLIQNNELHYLFSYSFDMYNSKRKSLNQKRHALKAFAPVYFTDASDLPYSKEEVETISNHISGKTYFHQEASLKNFLNSLGDTEIIHLATHADGTATSPFITFYDGVITFNELSTHYNNTSLIVLSACETSSGELANGEGVLSLARSFFYGGAQSTLSTLWETDDKASMYIMDSFYKYLSAGQTKSYALRAAKTDYLNTHTGSELSPYYWSSFILTGAVDPVSQENNLWTYLLVLISVIMAGFALILLSRKRKNSPS